VLVAIDVPPSTRDDLNDHLDDLGFRYWDETDNDAYTLFLKAT
jgi:threonine dehydratase